MSSSSSSTSTTKISRTCCTRQYIYQQQYNNNNIYMIHRFIITVVIVIIPIIMMMKLAQQHHVLSYRLYHRSYYYHHLRLPMTTYLIRKQQQQQPLLRHYDHTRRNTFSILKTSSSRCSRLYSLSSLLLSNNNDSDSIINEQNDTTTRTIDHHQLSEQKSQSQLQDQRTIYTIDYCPPTDILKLQQIVTKHIHTISLYTKKRPIAYHTQIAFTTLLQQLQLQQRIQEITILNNNNTNNNTTTIFIPKQTIVLDSGCGTGRSTIRLGQLYPNSIIFGIDRSIIRLTKNQYVQKTYIPLQNYQQVHNLNRTLYENFMKLRSNNSKTNNLNNNNNNNGEDEPNTSSSSSSNIDIDTDDNIYSIHNNDNTDDDDDDDYDDPTRLVEQVSDNVWLIRAELVDMWRLLINHQWNTQIIYHYMYYPNPYPKCTRLQQRWYAHPSFPLLKELLVPSITSLSSSTETYNSSNNNHNHNHYYPKKMIIRSNWKQYLDEFAFSSKILFHNNIDNNQMNNDTSSTTSTDNITRTKTTKVMIQDPYVMNNIPRTKQEIQQLAMTNFEEKYWLVNERTYEFIICINE